MDENITSSTHQRIKSFYRLASVNTSLMSKYIDVFNDIFIFKLPRIAAVNNWKINQKRDQLTV